MSKRIHLNLFNFKGNINLISGQLDFLAKFCSKNDIKLTISNSFKKNIYNILIENFTFFDVQKIREFCVSESTKVGVIMTEHIDYIDTNFYFHGNNILEANFSNDYFSGLYSHLRFNSLLSIIDVVDNFIVLGHLPFLTNMDKVFPHIQKVNIPYDVIEFKNIKSEPEYDFIFFGFITPYRKKILDILRKNYSIYFKDNISTPLLKKTIIKAKVCIHIAQDPQWQWSSPVRLIQSISNGRCLVEFGSYGSVTGGDIVSDIIEVINPTDNHSIKNILNNHAFYLKKQINKFYDLNKKMDSYVDHSVLSLFIKSLSK